MAFGKANDAVTSEGSIFIENQDNCFSVSL